MSGSGLRGASLQRFVILLALLSVVNAPRPVHAHEISYSYIDVDWRADRISLSLSVHRDDAASALAIGSPDSLMQPAFLARSSEALAGLLAPRVKVRAGGTPIELRFVGAHAVRDRRAVRLEFVGPGRGVTDRLSIDARPFPENLQHETFLNVYTNGRLLRQTVLDASHSSIELYGTGAAGVWAVVRTFVQQGIHHIAIGPDHILFIVGLLLLGGGIARVLRVATAFTLAHSVTLVLAALGLLRVPSRLVEPAIALSIVWIGIENLRHRRGAPDRRTVLAFGFGLIHGLGFASVLRELSLPSQALGWSLLSFNLGVEIGQGAIVMTVAPLLGWLGMRRPRLTDRLLHVGSIAIIAVGVTWLVQRVVAPA